MEIEPASLRRDEACDSKLLFFNLEISKVHEINIYWEQFLFVVIQNNPIKSLNLKKIRKSFIKFTKSV